MMNSMKSKGFSLIEVLIALIILSIAFLGLAGLMIQTTRNNSFGGRITEAATFAQDKLEELRATTWLAITPGSDLINSNGEVKPWVPPSNLTSNKDFARKWTVDPNAVIAPYTEPTLNTITITVNWKDQTDHSIRVISAIANPDPK